PPHPRLFRARSPWLPEGAYEVCYSHLDENHLTNGYLTTGVTVNKGQCECSNTRSSRSWDAGHSELSFVQRTKYSAAKWLSRSTLSRRTPSMNYASIISFRKCQTSPKCREWQTSSDSSTTACPTWAWRWRCSGRACIKQCSMAESSQFPSRLW
ncbi:hypothetical protein PMAYCL1PPCAC_32217, partial [Pristionchus mayeri]